VIVPEFVFTADFEKSTDLVKVGDAVEDFELLDEAV